MRISAFCTALFAPALLSVATPSARADVSAADYSKTKLEDFARDQNGFLTPQVWDIIAAVGKANPNTNEARTIPRRAEYVKFMRSYAGWKAPEPPAPPPGKLRNLADKPDQPRFPLTGKVWPMREGDASLCLWEDDKVAAMSLGVDDNCAIDVSFWKDLSKKYGKLNITWNLITNNIDGGVERSGVGMAGTWSFWRNLIGEGYHVASHSVMHNADPVPADGWPGFAWETSESKRMMDANLGGYVTKTFVYPGSGVRAFSITRQQSDGALRQAIGKYYAAARGGGAFGISQANMIDYLEIHSTTAIESLVSEQPNPAWMADQKIKNLLDPNPNNKCYRGWANIFIHYVNQGKDFDINPGCVAYGKLLAFYNEHRVDLWTGFFDDVALYAEERDTATLKSDPASNSKLSFTLSDKMDPAVFNYPLTVKVRLPVNWKRVAALQNGVTVPAEVIVHELVPYALVKAVPDRGQISLTPAAK